VNNRILARIQTILHEINPNVQVFQQLKDLLKTLPAINYNIKLIDNYARDKTYNPPTTNEVACLIINDENNHSTNKRDIVIHNKNQVDPNTNQEKFQRINELHAAYDPLVYPILFPFGSQGYQPKQYQKLRS
jgi:hypothetical protein